MFKLIANPQAGKGRVRRSLPVIERLLTAAGVEFEMALTEGEGHATRLARAAAEAGWPVVVAVGGDGTMGEVLNGLVGTGAALGVLPVGTGNDLARTVGMSLDLRRAVRQLIGGQPRPFDVGRDRDAWFGIIVALGFPADVMHYCNTHSSLFQGSMAIFAAVVTLAPTLKPIPMRLEMDGGVVEGEYLALFVLNTPYTGGGLWMAPEARTDDGLFDVVAVRKMSKLEFLYTVPKAYRGKHVGHRCVEMYRSSRIKAITPEPVIKMFDGNIIGSSPIEAEVVPAGLKVIFAPGGGVDD